MDHFVIEFTEAERELMFEIAGQRRVNSVAKKGWDGLVDKKRDPMWADCEGVAGEVAFGHFIGSPPDLLVGAARADFTVNGVTVDVKTTQHATGSLLAGRNKRSANKRCELYVLVTVDWYRKDDPIGSFLRCPTCRIVGGMTSEELFSEERFGPICFGAPHSYNAKQSLLMPPSAVLAYLSLP